MKSFYIWFLLLSTLPLSAQNYLITFTGEGASNVVNTIEVDNLTTGESLIMDGNDTLILKGPVSNSYFVTNPFEISVSPNPFVESTIITIYSNTSQKTRLEVFNMSGALELSKDIVLTEGMNSLELSGLNKGVHFLRINGRNIGESSKIISLSDAHTDPFVKLVGKTDPLALKRTSGIAEMLYHSGDQMLYKGTSDIYSTIVTDIPESNKNITFLFIPCTDADTNHYTTLQIGNQRWMAENLNVGVKILGKWNQSNNSIVEKYCYNDIIENCDLYGGLYQWNEIRKFEFSSIQGICPENWRIPTVDELSRLAENLGGVSVAGGKLKEVRGDYWSLPNTGASNSSGFSALPGGIRNAAKSFSDLSLSGRFWSLTEKQQEKISVLTLNNESEEYSIVDMPKDEGYSVRCINCDTLIYPNVTITADENPVMFNEQAVIRATPLNGGTNPSYKWKVNGLIVGIDSDVLTYWPNFGDTVICYMTSNAMCVTGNPVKSNSIPISITAPACPGTPTVQYGGETYNTLQLGDQCWLARNLNIGQKIDHTMCGPPMQTNNGVIEKYCLDNLTANCTQYGGLYTWGEAMNYGEASSSNPSYVRGICPPMWHIPSKDEICELAMFLDPDFNCNQELNYYSTNGGILKEPGTVHWAPPNNGATNVTGFTARPTGFSDSQLNGFGPYPLGYSYVWTTTECPSLTYSYDMALDYQRTYLIIGNMIKTNGIGVRCIKDF